MQANDAAKPSIQASTLHAPHPPEDRKQRVAYQGLSTNETRLGFIWMGRKQVTFGDSDCAVHRQLGRLEDKLSRRLWKSDPLNRKL